jgi:hypothetical protein
MASQKTGPKHYVVPFSGVKGKVLSKGAGHLMGAVPFR